METSSFKNLLSPWLNVLKHQKSYSAHTLRAYQKDAVSFLEFAQSYDPEFEFSTQSLSNIPHTTVRAWLSHLHQQKLTERSIARAFSALKNWFDFLIESKIVNNNPCQKLKRPKIKKTLPRPLSIENIQDLLNAPPLYEDEDPWIIERNKALWMLLYSTGLRISEALQLNKKDISASRGFLKVLGKRRKERLVPLLHSVLEQIQKYLHASSSSNQAEQPLFVGKKGGRLNPGVAQHIMRQYRLLLNLSPKATPHSLRHSCATHLVDESKNLRAVQELLGHESLSTTQIYTEVALQKVFKTYEAAHPRSAKKEASFPPEEKDPQ